MDLLKIMAMASVAKSAAKKVVNSLTRETTVINPTMMKGSAENDMNVVVILVMVQEVVITVVVGVHVIATLGLIDGKWIALSAKR